MNNPVSYKYPVLWIVIILLLVPLIVFTGINWLENKYQALPVLGPTAIVNDKNTTHRVHPFTLINQDSVLFNSNMLKGKIVVVNFFFIHCGSICPKMTKHLQWVVQAFTKDNDVQLVSCTVDPERDTPAFLKQYAIVYNIDNSRWNLLTGQKKDIYRLARKEFFLTATDGDGGVNDFIHSDQLVLLDRQQQIRGYYSGINDRQVEQLIKDIKKLRHE